jgi:hypothetical protein
MSIGLVCLGCEAPANGTVWDYPAHCEGTVDRRANSCSGSITFVLNRRSFTVDAQQQRVIYQYESAGSLPVQLQGCVVKDVENWVCEQRLIGWPEIYTRTMSHGQYNEFGLVLANDDVVYLSRSEWSRVAGGHHIDGLRR